MRFILTQNEWKMKQLKPELSTFNSRRNGLLKLSNCICRYTACHFGACSRLLFHFEDLIVFKIYEITFSERFILISHFK